VAGRFNLFIKITSNLQAEQFIPEQVVRVMADGLAESAREKILGRVTRGEFPGNPDGTGPVRTQGYSTNPASFPLRRVGDASRTRTSRYDTLGRQVESRAGSTPRVDVFRRSGNPWTWVPGGYTQFRAMAGLPSAPVTLSFTGRLLEDLVVKPTIERFGEEGMTAAATVVGGGKIASGAVGKGFSKAFDLDFGLADVIASIHLSIGFSTQSSWRIARYQAEGYDRHFALLTPEEKTELGREALSLARTARKQYSTSSPSVAPRNERGQFISIRF